MRGDDCAEGCAVSDGGKSGRKERKRGYRYRYIVDDGVGTQLRLSMKALVDDPFLDMIAGLDLNSQRKRRPHR